MSAYYNEIDPFAAQWLRELIKAGHIADGDVDERSIEDVRPDDLRPYTQCHFFAGIGVWSYALRRAGWDDDRHIWTGSCPCQPFSAAGQRKGASDERHLWPAFHHLIRECRPDVVFGEQVEAAINHGWLDLVSDDMEGEGYAFGAVGFPACSVGAPHIRHRLYWVAESDRQRDWRMHSYGYGTESAAQGGGQENARADETGGDSTVVGMAYGTRHRREQGDTDDGRYGKGADTQWVSGRLAVRDEVQSFTVANTNDTRSQGRSIGRDSAGEFATGTHSLELQRAAANAVKGHWGGADWLWCRDGKWRPVEPETFPLVNGDPARVGRLRGYGNAIVAPQAEAFIRAYMDDNRRHGNGHH